MRKRTLGAFCVALILHLDCFCQSKSEQIKQLQKIAQDNELRAKNAEEQAEKYNRVAQEAQREAERQRYLSLAVSLSRKSLEVDDSTLAGLLALQAYNYNTRFKGYDFDADIYQGLLSALQRFGDGRKELVESKYPVCAFVSKPDLAGFLALENDGRVLRWDDARGEWNAKELMPTKDGFDMLGVCVRPDGRLWMIGKKKELTSRVGIYDVTYSSKKIEGIYEQIDQVVFSPDANYYHALSSSGHAIFYCDPQKGKEVVRLGEKIVLIDVSRDGSKLAGVTLEGNLYVWDIKKEYSRSVYKISSEGNRITAIAFTPLGRDIVIGDEKGKINFLVVENGAIRRTLSTRSLIKHITFSNLGNLMAVTDKLNVIRIWNLSNLNHLPLMINEKDEIGPVAFSSDGNDMMCATVDKQPSIHVWPLNADAIAKGICKFLSRNMSIDDWEQYVGSVPYETTCPNLPMNDR